MFTACVINNIVNRKEGRNFNYIQVDKIKTDKVPTGKIISRKVGQSPIAFLSDNNRISQNCENVKYLLEQNEEVNVVENLALFDSCAVSDKTCVSAARYK